MRAAVARPRRTILIGLIVVAAAALGLPRLEIRTDGASLVPGGHPQIRYDREVRRDFDIRDQFIVTVRSDHPNGVYNAASLALVKDLTERIAGIDGVEPGDLMSLATEYGDRVVPGTLTARTFLDPPPRTDEELTRVREDLERIRLYTGTLISFDASAAAIYVGVPDGADRPRLYGRLIDLIAAAGPHVDQVSVVGGPVAETLLGTHLLHDLGVPAWITGPGVDGAPLPATGGLGRLRRSIAGTTGLLPIALAVLALVLLVAFRRVGAMLLPMAEAGLCLVFVFGLMGWCGVPVYLTIAVMPVILTAVGIADEIHVFHRFRTHARAEPDADRRELVTRTMDEMSRPVTRTSVTTAIGFLSFAVSPIGPVQAFGLFTAAGVMFCMLFSLAVVPACLVLVPTKRLVSPAPGRRADRAASGFGRLPARPRSARRPLAVIALAIVVFLVAPLGIRKIEVQDSWIDGFGPESAFALATRAFNRDFLGVHILRVIAEADGLLLTGEVDADALGRLSLTLPADAIDAPDDLVGAWIGVREAGADKDTDPEALRRADLASIKSPIDRVEQDGGRLVLVSDRRHGPLGPAAGYDDGATLRYAVTARRFVEPETITAIRDLERFIASHREDAVGGILGPGNYVETTNFLVSGRQEQHRSIPDSVHRQSRVWDHFVRVRGEERLHNLVDDRFDRAIVTVFLKDANFRSTRHLMDSIRAYEAEHLAPRGISLGFAGDVAVSQTLIEAIVSTQVRSLVLSLVGIFIVSSLLGRSLGWGLLCVLPCACALIVIFAALGAAGVPLGVATSMFAGMTLGIGVDYAIHLMERCRAARAGGFSLEESVTDAVRATAPAILVDALALTAGFGVLMLSEVPANARLGAILCVSVAACLLVTLLLLPALILTWAPRALR